MQFHQEAEAHKARNLEDKENSRLARGFKPFPTKFPVEIDGKIVFYAKDNQNKSTTKFEK